MKYMDSVELPLSDGWPSYLNGFFKMWDGAVKFCYDEYNRVMARNEDGTSEVWYTAPEGEILKSPSRWANACPGYSPMLNSRGEKDNTDEIYYFDDYAISHKSEWSYVCKQDGKEIWTFKGYAWRYTCIERYGDNIYFGTAGQGGYFYLLNLHTGEPLVKLKTGGSVNIYARQENKLYLLQQEKKAYLVCVDLNDGTILERLELPGTVKDECAVKLIGNTVHAVTLFFHKNRSFSHACWHRIEV